jgi:small subunit ribosomal protein S9
MARKKKADEDAAAQDAPREGAAEAEVASEGGAPAAEEAPRGEAAQAAEAAQAEAGGAEGPEAEAASTESAEPEAVQGEQAPREDAPAGAPQPELAQAGEPPSGAAPPPPARAPASATAAASEAEEEAAEEPAEGPARAKPSVPGAHLEVDIVPEGVDPLGRGEEQYEDPYALEEDEAAPAQAAEEEAEEVLTEPIASAAIDLAAGARYRATGKRKTAIARVTLRPGSGAYVVNGRTLEEHFPRATLQRNIRQPLETVGYHERMDVLARLHGGGISAQAGALRHGVSRALLEADPNLRGELKRRGFLTRDSRAKERKKAGLKKARKRPQFSKR